MNLLELPADAQGPFYTAVWKIVRLVPPGKVVSYGQVGSYIPCPAGVPAQDYPAARARWVGSAMAACPADVPWQRVINAQGKISIRSGAQGAAAAEQQRRLLESEGVLFDSRDRVNLLHFGWQGPDAEWLRENGFVAPNAPAQPTLW